MRTAFRFRSFVLLVLFAFAFTLLAAPAPSLAQSTLKEIQKRGKLLAGVRFDIPPNGYLNVRGEHVGFGPDIARELARHLGVDVEFVQTTSKNRIPLLLNGQIDADIGPTTPTKTRDEVIDFSHTYVMDQVVIMVRKGDSTDPESYFNTDKTVGVLQGSFLLDLWKAHSQNATFKEYQEFPELVIALAQGKVDVVPGPLTTVHDLIEKLGERAEGLAVGGVFFEDPQAIGLRENDSDWRDWVNWALQRMWAEGTFQELYKKHYRTEPPFHLWENNRLQPGYEKVAKKNDPWSVPSD